MQRFISELSSVIEKAEFDRSWQSEASARAELNADFAFDGRRISATIHSEERQPMGFTELSSGVQQGDSTDQCKL